MTKQEAITLIEDTFNKKFDEDRFLRFAKNLLNDTADRENVYRGNYIKDAYKEHIAQYKRIGKYTDPNGDEIDILTVEVHDHSKLDKARTALRNFVITHLDNFEKDYALVAFYARSDEGADWRFSFVKLEYRTEVKEGKLKQRKELTPAKRYSFLVGEHEKAHTAKAQLLPYLQNVYNNPTVAELEQAFSIETVTNEFFEQYKLLFGKLVEQFEKDTVLKAELVKSNVEISRFAKKLLGQIVFLYFLQKKGWMGVDKAANWGSGKKNFLQALYTEAEQNNKNYFADYLQYLFYEALAKEHNNEGVNGYYTKLRSRIPFLNGGLFEADYDWQNANISIPNELFRNDEKLKSDTGTGILDVFDRYNFTIKEDEPLEKEVAVDPEMLGKVFENLLDENLRKSKGAFYTPREIVHYMCQESLIHYLENTINDTTTAYQSLGHSQLALLPEAKKGQFLLRAEHKDEPIPKTDLEEFIRHGFFALENDQRVIKEGKETRTYQFQLPESIRHNADKLDHCLSHIKICDPAIGSGAYPVGLLHELVNAQLVLRQYLSPSYLKAKLKELDLPQQEYEKNPSKYIYRLKRHTIQESIYGVDIDASAIDVARLRLWLSMVVDEDDLDSIEALPNLDYKIVCGNSLIGLPENGVIINPNIQNEIEKLKEEFFEITDETRKKSLRSDINNKIRQLLDSAELFAGYKIDFDFKLYFSEVWREKGGFDIVIGNPPYGASLNESEKNILKVRFANISERIRNSYLYFIGVGENLINKKRSVNYIIPNEFLFQVYMGKARKYYLTYNKMLKAINIGEDAFKAIVPTCIIMFEKSIAKNYEFDAFDFRNTKLHKIEERLLSGNSIKLKSEVILKTPNQTYSFDSKSALLVNYLTSVGSPFENFCDDVANGICTSHDKVYVVSQDMVNRRSFEPDFVKPTLKGKDFNRFFCPKTPPNYILYIDKDFIPKNAPNIYAYLEENKDELIAKSVEKTHGSRDWHILFRSRNKELFETMPKILIRQTGDSIIASVDEQIGYFCINSVNIAQLKKQFFNKAHYLLQLLNSEVLNFYYREISQEAGRVLAEVKPTRVKSLPIIQNDNCDSLIYLSNYLSFLVKDQSKLLFQYFIDLSNALVYELYFPTEIKAAGKDILKHLTDLEPIEDSMSEEQKLAIIQRAFERLYDPSHPVRNAVETLDSIEEVRIIKEALKK